MPILTIGTGRSLLYRQPVVSASYEAESSAIFAAFSTPPADARKTVINDLVVALKACGAWSILDVIYIFAAADSQAALINWKNPGTYNGTESASMSFSADDGFTGDGAKYIDSGYMPGDGNYGTNSASLCFRILNSRTTASGVQAAMGSFFSKTAPLSTGENFTCRMHGDNTLSIANANAQGHYIASRTASNLTTAYKNGSSIGSTADPSTYLPSQTISVFAEHRGSGSFVDQSSDQIASAFIGGGMDSTMSAAVATAEAAYMTAVGAI